MFFAGVGFWLVFAGGALLFYVVHRNTRVLPAARVLTKTHITRLISGDKASKKRKTDKGLRVRVIDHEGNFVERPGDPDEEANYDAAQDFLFDVLWRRASDVDLLAGKEKYRAVFHIDGVATEKSDGLPAEQGERIFRFLKSAAGLNVEEYRRPQKGRIQAALLSHNGDVGYTEVRTSGTTAGERLRIHFQHGPALMRINELGIAPQRAEALKAVLGKASGMVMITSTPRNGVLRSAQRDPP